MQTLVFNDSMDFIHTLLKEEFCTNLAEFRRNITCLRIFPNRLTKCQFSVLLQTYGDQLEELMLSNFDTKAFDSEWIELLIKYGNSNRLRKWSLSVNSTESLEVLCDKFSDLTLFKFDRGKETDESHAVQFFSLTKLKRLQV